MDDFNLNRDDILSALRRNLEDFKPTCPCHRSDASSRSATASPACRSARRRVNELLEFEDGTVGLALNLDEESIGAVVLGDGDAHRGGPAGQGHRRHPAVPVGDGMLGRVVNALGEPIDGKGPITRRRCGAWRSRRPASRAASPCTSRCRPASRPSTR
jgi:F-type H+-transporting ATPase subunit alpha